MLTSLPNFMQSSHNFVAHLFPNSQKESCALDWLNLLDDIISATDCNSRRYFGAAIFCGSALLASFSKFSVFFKCHFNCANSGILLNRE